MTVAERLLSEFDPEMANTRKTLERVPEKKLDWKPHAKSRTMGGLASHLAGIPGMSVSIVELESLDVAPPGKSAPPRPPAKTPQEVLETFDKSVAAARVAIAGASDEHWKKPWTFLFGGRKIFTLPRIGALRALVMNHIIHHRAQLGVYLRLNDVPVPSIYGPSADEGQM